MIEEEKSREILTFILYMKAVIDMGSQSLRLLKFTSKEDLLTGRIDSMICPLARDLENGYLKMSRKKEALAIIRGFIQGLDKRRVYLYATSALREAGDGQAFIDEIVGEFGIEAEIISGQEEAQLGYRGVEILAGPKPFAMLDLGGGSTEIVDEKGAVSFPMGVVRYEDGTDLAGIYGKLARTQLDLYGIGGSLSLFVSLAQGINHYDRKMINGKELNRREISDLTSKMKAMSREERKSYLGEFSKRVDTAIPAGIILDFLLAQLGESLIYCDYTALEAYAISRGLV